MRAVHQQPGRAIEIFLGTLLTEVPAGGPGGGGGGSHMEVFSRDTVWEAVSRP